VTAFGSGDDDESLRVHYAFDELGRTETVEDGHGTVTHVYDDDGRMLSIDSPEGLISYEYDQATGRLERTYTADTDISYGYDELGRLQAVAVDELAATDYSSAPLVTTYGYDAVGNLITTTLPNDVVTTYTYDDLNRLVLEVVEDDQSNLLASYEYVLLPDGQRDYMIETDDSSVETKVDWTHDNLKRLVREVRDEGDDGIDDTNDYDTAYTLDLVGNRLEKVTDKPSTSNDETIEYEYNAKDQLESEDSTLTGETTYAYDANGSLVEKIHDSQTDTYGYDLRNRMVESDVDDVESTYVYDDNGVRVAKTVDSETTEYLIDPQNHTGYAKPIEEHVASAVARAYVLGHDILAQEDATNGLLYLLKDGHGTTRMLVDSSAAIEEQYLLTAFQEPVGFSLGDAKTSWLSPDGSSDVETSFTYQLARYRNGFWFTQADIPGASRNTEPLTLHKYLYVHGDPIMGVDPSGMSRLTELLLVITVIAILTTMQGDDPVATVNRQPLIEHYRAVANAANPVYVDTERLTKTEAFRQKTGTLFATNLKEIPLFIQSKMQVSGGLPVDYLSIGAHGGPGLITLFLQGNPNATIIDKNSFKIYELHQQNPNAAGDSRGIKLLNDITPFLAANATIEIVGCEAGAGTTGRELEQMMERFFGDRGKAVNVILHEQSVHFDLSGDPAY